jgi:uncharacterized protein
MTQPAKGQEPSMEEILASIRRIIADDDSTESASRAGDAANAPPRAAAPLSRMAPPAAPPRESAAREEEIDLMLARLHGESRPVPASEEPAPTERMAEPPAHANRLAAAFERREPEPHAPRAAEERRGALDDRGLISAVTSAAVESNFNALAHVVHARDGRTVEELISELLRPLLKAWLDENLPSMVERLVGAEIERVSRGKR